MLSKLLNPKEFDPFFVRLHGFSAGECVYFTLWSLSSLCMFEVMHPGRTDWSSSVVWECGQKEPCLSGASMENIIQNISSFKRRTRVIVVEILWVVFECSWYPQYIAALWRDSYKQRMTGYNKISVSLLPFRVQHSSERHVFPTMGWWWRAPHLSKSHHFSANNIPGRIWSPTLRFKSALWIQGFAMSPSPQWGGIGRWSW